MKYARRLAILLLLCAAILIAPAGAETGADEPLPQLIYFFENYCDACHPEVEFIETFHTLTGRNVSDYAYSYYNIRFEQNRALYQVMEAQPFLVSFVQDQ